MKPCRRCLSGLPVCLLVGVVLLASDAARAGGPCSTPADCDDGVACTVDTCELDDNKQLVCVHTPQASLCGDGVACTLDQCHITLGCQHFPIHSSCNNGLFCDGTETCHATLGCQAGTPPNCNDNITCTTDACNEATDSCTHVSNCDDGIPCTNDTCSMALNQCIFAPDDSFCNDNQFCNGQEFCSPTSGCQFGTPPVCDDGVICTIDSCNEATDSCSNVSNCEDGIACTVDTCNPTLNQCFHTPNNAVCSDGLFCNGSEVCNAAVGCQNGPPPNCSDGIACTTDTCSNPAAQCLHTPNHAACDNGQFCDGVEVCTVGVGCEPTEPVDCDDGITCTSDSCNEFSDQCVSTTECNETFLRVNLEWRNPMFLANNTQFQVELFAVPSGNLQFSHLVAGIEAVVTWDPAVLQIQPLLNNGPYTWMPSRFPNDAASDNLNEGVTVPPLGLPFNDGDAYYEAVGQFGPPLGIGPAVLPSTGLKVTTFRFSIVPGAVVDTMLTIEPDAGQATCTRVYFGGFGFTCVPGGGTCSPTNPQACGGQPNNCQVFGATPNCDIKNLLPTLHVLGPCSVPTCGDADLNGVTDDNCTFFSCQASTCTPLDRLFGDLGGAFGACLRDNFVNLFDRTHALTCFAGTNPCWPVNLDAGGAFGSCNPDGFCNLFDANHTLLAFSGQNACSCPSPAAPQFEPRTAGSAELVLIPEAKTVRPGQRVAVQVFMDSALDDLQSFQLHLAAEGGRAGRFELVDVRVDEREDYVFAGYDDAFDAFNSARGQMLAGLSDGGVTTDGRDYLATFIYQASRDAVGDFVIDVLHDEAGGDQSFVVSNFTDRVDITRVQPAVIRVKPTVR